MMRSIQLPEESELRAVIGPGYDADTTLNVIKMFAGTGDMFDVSIAFIDALFASSDIDPKAREMIVLRTATIMNAPYEWQANAAMARNLGLSPQEIDATAVNGPVTGVHPDFVLLCKATDELSTNATLSDATVDELLQRYDQTLCRKYVLIIAWFNLLPRFVNGCRVPLETTDKIGSKTSPLAKA
jgi:alkylhydroperoxidase family enzyme